MEGERGRGEGYLRFDMYVCRSSRRDSLYRWIESVSCVERLVDLERGVRMRSYKGSVVTLRARTLGMVGIMPVYTSRIV